MAGADRTLVSRAGRPGGAGADLAADRGPSPVDHRSAEGAGDGGHDCAAAARRPPRRGVGVDGTSLHCNHFHRGTPRRQGHGAAWCGRARQRSPDRLRQARHVVRPGLGAPGRGVGVRDDPVVFTGTVRPTGAADGPNVLERFACGGVRVLRRRPGAAGVRQPQDRGDAPGSV